MKEISLDTSLYDLTEKYPELIPILVGLGFGGVGDPDLRKTHGKVMTIRKGCEMTGKEVGEVARALEKQGFKLVG